MSTLNLVGSERDWSLATKLKDHSPPGNSRPRCRAIVLSLTPILLSLILVTERAHSPRYSCEVLALRSDERPNLLPERQGLIVTLFTDHVGLENPGGDKGGKCTGDEYPPLGGVAQ